MKKGSELIGIPIISKEEGRREADVREIIYSKHKLRVIGFLLNEGGLFKEPLIVKFKDICNIGNDAIIIESKKVIEKASSIPEIDVLIAGKQKIIGTEVITEDGESLGFIQDIIFDEEKGKIMGFSLTDGLLQDIMDGRNILPYINGITFGGNSLVISSKIKEEFNNNKKLYKKLLELE